MNEFSESKRHVMMFTLVKIIRDVIIVPNPYTYTAKFVFLGVKTNEDKQMRRLKINKTRT